MDTQARATTVPHDLAAVVHLHPDRSAGVPEIVEAAADAEADAVFLADRIARDDPEGWQHGVLLLAGLELSPIHGRFLLWSLAGGPEPMDHPPARELAEWDRLCSRRRVVAIGGVDAPFRNERTFRMLRTHLLCEHAPTGSLDDDRELVLDALRRGRCFVGRDALANTRNFRFFADGPNGFVPMGGEAAPDDWTVHVRLPREAELRVIKDGRQVHRVEPCRRLDLPADSTGVYRVEARLSAQGRARTWIVSNPIYLRAH